MANTWPEAPARPRLCLNSTCHVRHVLESPRCRCACNPGENDGLARQHKQAVKFFGCDRVGGNPRHEAGLKKAMRNSR
jgi:hypothetical protein